MDEASRAKFLEDIEVAKAAVMMGAPFRLLCTERHNVHLYYDVMVFKAGLPPSLQPGKPKSPSLLRRSSSYRGGAASSIQQPSLVKTKSDLTWSLRENPEPVLALKRKASKNFDDDIDGDEERLTHTPTKKRLSGQGKELKRGTVSSSTLNLGKRPHNRQSSFLDVATKPNRATNAKPDRENHQMLSNEPNTEKESLSVRSEPAPLHRNESVEAAASSSALSPTRKIPLFRKSTSSLSDYFSPRKNAQPIAPSEHVRSAEDAVISLSSVGDDLTEPHQSSLTKGEEAPLSLRYGKRISSASSEKLLDAGKFVGPSVNKPVEQPLSTSSLNHMHADVNQLPSASLSLNSLLPESTALDLHGSPPPPNSSVLGKRRRTLGMRRRSQASAASSSASSLPKSAPPSVKSLAVTSKRPTPIIPLTVRKESTDGESDTATPEDGPLILEVGHGSNRYGKSQCGSDLTNLDLDGNAATFSNISTEACTSNSYNLSRPPIPFFEKKVASFPKKKDSLVPSPLGRNESSIEMAKVLLRVADSEGTQALSETRRQPSGAEAVATEVLPIPKENRVEAEETDGSTTDNDNGVNDEFGVQAEDALTQVPSPATSPPRIGAKDDVDEEVSFAGEGGKDARLEEDEEGLRLSMMQTLPISGMEEKHLFSAMPDAEATRKELVRDRVTALEPLIGDVLKDNMLGVPEQRENDNLSASLRSSASQPQTQSPLNASNCILATQSTGANPIKTNPTIPLPSKGLPSEPEAAANLNMLNISKAEEAERRENALDSIASLAPLTNFKSRLPTSYRSISLPISQSQLIPVSSSLPERSRSLLAQLNVYKESDEEDFSTWMPAKLDATESKDANNESLSPTILDIRRIPSLMPHPTSSLTLSAVTSTVSPLRPLTDTSLHASHASGTILPVSFIEPHAEVLKGPAMADFSEAIEKPPPLFKLGAIGSDPLISADGVGAGRKVVGFVEPFGECPISSPQFTSPRGIEPPPLKQDNAKTPSNLPRKAIDRMGHLHESSSPAVGGRFGASSGGGKGSSGRQKRKSVKDMYDFFGSDGEEDFQDSLRGSPMSQKKSASLHDHRENEDLGPSVKVGPSNARQEHANLMATIIGNSPVKPGSKLPLLDGVGDKDDAELGDGEANLLDEISQFVDDDVNVMKRLGLDY
ncbi:hypothetical protein HDU67_006655 [Dinochytrium kinnereticum]|nr:hypothetical protein HDU67_006655 [Dinochytrium kinnereticum]